MALNSTPQGLTLTVEHNGELKHLMVDFLAPSLQFRIQRAQHQGDPLLKAFGLKVGQASHIIDATAGLGQDSFLLASLGHTVTLIERDENLHALLQDGLARAKQNPDCSPIIERMQLFHAQAIECLPDLAPALYIYLDPMFPAKRKSALSKQPMEMLKDLLDTQEQPELLDVARQCAKKRVIVKRPKHAPFLGEQKPTFSQRYQSCRFDVYVNS